MCSPADTPSILRLGLFWLFLSLFCSLATHLAGSCRVARISKRSSSRFPLSFFRIYSQNPIGAANIRASIEGYLRHLRYLS